MTDVNPHMKEFGPAAALPDGGAFVINRVRSNHTEQVLRVKGTGHVIQHVYQCVRCDLSGLLVLKNNLYVIHVKGILLEFDIDNTNTVQAYQVPDVNMTVHYGSLSYHPSVITHPDLLLLADNHKGEIFSYNVTSKNKQVHLTGLNGPTSVSFMTYNSHLCYVVSEYLNHQVLVYTSNWTLYEILGGTEGSGDGQFNRPYSAIGLPDGSVVVSDRLNNRVCVYSIHGQFVRHLITESDGVYRPGYMSVSLPYMWVAGTHGLYRYKLY